MQSLLPSRTPGAVSRWVLAAVELEPPRMSGPQIPSYNVRGGKQKSKDRLTDLGLPGPSSGQGQSLGKAGPEPGLGAWVGIVADSDESQDTGEVLLHRLVFDGNQPLLLDTWKPMGVVLGPGPCPMVGQTQSPKQGTTPALHQLGIHGTYPLHKETHRYTPSETWHALVLHSWSGNLKAVPPLPSLTKAGLSLPGERLRANLVWKSHSLLCR